MNFSFACRQSTYEYWLEDHPQLCLLEYNSGCPLQVTREFRGPGPAAPMKQLCDLGHTYVTSAGLSFLLRALTFHDLWFHLWPGSFCACLQIQASEMFLNLRSSPHEMMTHLVIVLSIIFEVQEKECKIAEQYTIEGSKKSDVKCRVLKWTSRGRCDPKQLLFLQRPQNFYDDPHEATNSVSQKVFNSPLLLAEASPDIEDDTQ